MRGIECNQRKNCFRTEVDALESRKRRRDGGVRYALCSQNGGDGTTFHRFCSSSALVFLACAIFLVSLSEPTSAAAWLSDRRRQSHSEKALWNRSDRNSFDSRTTDHRRFFPCSRKTGQWLYANPKQQRIPDRDNGMKKIKTKEYRFVDDDDLKNNNDLDSLRAQAAKLREEADSLQSAIQESKEAKIQREIDKVDGWIDDLLIEVTLGDGTELLKTVDQVYDVLVEERYSANHVLKIFERLCDLREQESRSNCSPLMELLIDATGKLDCTEREDCANKRWNHKVERVLRKKLFARDWNIQYISEDEKNW